MRVTQDEVIDGRDSWRDRSDVGQYAIPRPACQVIVRATVVDQGEVWRTHQHTKPCSYIDYIDRERRCSSRWRRSRGHNASPALRHEPQRPVGELDMMPVGNRAD